MSTAARVLSGYNATPEGDDGLTLAALLSELLGGDLVVARVLPGPRKAVVDREDERRRRELAEDTRAAVLAALPDAPRPVVVPVPDSRLARALHDLAEGEDAACVTLGSTHHSRVGRAVLGGTADVVIAGATRPVAVAPPGFREHVRLAHDVVSVGYDGTPASADALALGRRVAKAAGVPLRIVTVQPPPLDRPLPRTGPRHPEAALATLAPRDPDGPPEQRVLRHGHPATVLEEEARRTGLLVLGTHARGPLKRAFVGSVAMHVVRHAPCPVIVCPPPRG